MRDSGHRVVIYCTYGLNGGVQDWEGIECLPNTGEGYTDNIIKGHIRYTQPDLVLTLFDLWPLSKTDIPAFIQQSGARWAAWFPIDAVPVSRANLEVLKEVTYPIALANFAEAALNEYGYKTTVIPHGIEKAYGFTATGRREFRRHLQVPDDAFLYGSVGRNAYYPGRKGFDRLMRAFSELERPDAYLYIHALANSESGSVPLPQIAEFYGITDRVRFADDYNGIMGYSQVGMNSLYSALDCYVQPTLGEGFGIPVLEAQACGAVVIATDCTSMPELLCPDASQLVPGATELFVPDPSHRVLIDIGKLKDAMREVYDIKASNPDGFSAMKARAGLWANGWDWDRIWQECWVPLLQTISDEIRESPQSKRHRGNGLVLDMGSHMRKQDSTLRSPAVAKELALMQTLDHPNIIPILASGVTPDGVAYFDMPKYTSLAGVDPETLSETEKHRIMDGVASALNYLHDRLICHRDVHPHNVVLDEQNNPYLIDFEWAHPCEGRPCVDFEPWLVPERAVPIVQVGMEQRGYHTIVQFLRGVDLSEKTHGFKGVPYQNIDGVGERDCELRWNIMQPDVKGKTVIDFGCNLGWFVRKAIDAGARYAHGIDNDAVVVEAARQLATGVQSTYEVANLDDNPENWTIAGTFDVGFLLSVLQHVNDPDALFFKALQMCDVLYVEIPSRFITDRMAEVLASSEQIGESERGRPIYRVRARVAV